MDIREIDDSTWEKEHDAWAKLIGNFMLTCGEIEARTYELIYDLATEDLTTIIRIMSFSNRANLIRVLLPQKVNDSHLLTAIPEALSNAEIIMKDRNILAHNPLDLAIWGNYPMLDVRKVIRKYCETEHQINDSERSFEDVELVLEEAVKTSSHLNELGYRLRVWIDNIQAK